MELHPGDLVADRYKIIRELGESEHEAVFECQDTRTLRSLAVRVFLHEGASTWQRIQQSATVPALAGSAHLTEIFDLGRLDPETPFLVMEYLDGPTLGGLLRERGKLTPAELIPIATQLLDGLGAMHVASFIHRDIRPDNVHLLRAYAGIPGFVKIGDSRVLEHQKSRLDSTGAVMGSPYYMSPEQAKGSREIDSRSDLYAVGVVLYEAVTGQVPFDADTFNELIFKIVLEAPRPLEELAPDLDPAFGAIILQGMARDPAQRFSSAADFRDALVAWSSRSTAS